MLGKKALDSLPAEARREIVKTGEKLKRGEINHGEYKEVCAEIISEYGVKEREEERGTETKRGRPFIKDDQKPEYMSDIIHYAGVNLKEEAMHIAKETEQGLPIDEGLRLTTDFQNTVDSLFDSSVFVYFVKKICSLRDVNVSEEAMQVVFQACKRKIMDLLEKMIQQSKFRTDVARSEYLIRIENDRRRQLWFLEQEERIEMEKYKSKKEDDDGDGNRKWRKILQEREDLIIKKRLSNNVALAALGSQPKSWMASTASSVDDGSAPYLTLLQGPEERTQKSTVRIINKEDFLSVLSRDKKYNKSIFTIKNTYL